MPEISRAEVAHLARLARLALSDDELDRFAGQLDVILGAVATIGEVAADDVPPTSHSVPLTNVFRPDVVVASLPRDDVLAQARPPPRTAGSGCRGSWTRSLMTDLTTWTAAETAAAIAAGEVSAVEVTQAHLDRIAAVDGEVHAFLHVDTDGRARAGRPGRRRRADRPARRRAAGAQGRHRPEGHPDHLRVEDPRGLAAAVRRDGGRPAQGRRRRHPRQDQHGRVRHGLLDRALRLRPDPQPVGPRPHPRRVRRRVRRSGRVLPGTRWRSAPTPAARSGSRPRSPARSASSRPTAGSAATASSRSPARWTRPARAPAPCSTPRCCTRSSPATTRATRPPSTRRCRPVVEAARRADVKGHADRRRQGAVRRRLPGRRAAALRRGGRAADRARGRRSSRSAARTSPTRCRPTT